MVQGFAGFYWVLLGFTGFHWCEGRKWEETGHLRAWRAATRTSVGFSGSLKQLTMALRALCSTPAPMLASDLSDSITWRPSASVHFVNVGFVQNIVQELNSKY